MKALKPSHREKRRYILLSGENADEKNIEEAVLKFLGILGYARASPQIIKTLKEKLILSVNRTELEKIRAAVLMSGKNIRIERVSGTLKNLA